MRIAVDPEKNAVSHGYPRPFLLSAFEITAPYNVISAFDRLSLSESSRLRLPSEAFRKLLRIQVIREKFSERYQYLPELPISPKAKTVYLVGYWQTYRLAESIADDLQSEFRFCQPAAGKTLETLNLINKSESPVSIHIRRGDYTLAVEGQISLPISYQIKSMEFLASRLPNPTFFVFSDDIGYARANLPQNLPIVFVDHNDSQHAHEDLRLMSSCRHHIIANSTFSWWGAWLNPRHDKIVVAPRDWLCKPGTSFPDLLPRDWILRGPTD